MKARAEVYGGTLRESVVRSAVQHRQVSAGLSRQVVRAAMGVALLLSMCLLSACADDATVVLGQTRVAGSLLLPLTTTLDGLSYGLDATLDVAGPQDLTLTAQRGDAGLRQDLEPGSYVVTLRDDFQVHRLTVNGDAEPVPAQLLSPASQAAEIESASVTRLAFRFALGEQTVAFGSGELAIDLHVEHPRCSGAAPLQAFSELPSVPAHDGVSQLVYAPLYSKLVVRNAGSSVALIDIETGAAQSHLANARFVDMSLSPDGRYLFAADYGGEQIGYGAPSGQSYVHRLDLADGSWEMKSAYIAGNIQATAADRFVLKSMDQWVTFYYAAWDAAATVTQLTASDVGVYSGDFRYDSRTHRLIHGNSGLSSQEIQAFKIVDDDFVAQEGSGGYGSASGYGPTVALATDSSAFYYGRLGVDGRDVTHTRRVFPETVYAAFGDIAFGSLAYYDPSTGAPLGSLGFNTSIYGLNPNGRDFWAYDDAGEAFRHFAPTQCSHEAPPAD